MKQIGLLRIVFQFSKSCNMACPYCYCRFTKEPIDHATCFHIIDRCHEIGVKIVTFAGGDPLLCSFIWELIRYTKSKNIEVHLDTNGLSLSQSAYRIISDNVSLLSFPLDGPTAAIHGQMRGSPTHFDVVTSHLSEMSAHPCRIKINTVVALPNHNHLTQLGRLLEKYRISIWSLQQFWPMERGFTNAEPYLLNAEDYDLAVLQVRNSSFPFLIEYGLVNERRHHHLFVTHSARVFIHSLAASDTYTELGSFFDPLTLEKWRSLEHSSVHPKSIHRYKNL